MTSLNWTWEPIEIINLDDCPTDTWEEAYHWLENQVSGEVVVKIDEDGTTTAYICEVRDD